MGRTLGHEISESPEVIRRRNIWMTVNPGAPEPAWVTDLTRPVPQEIEFMMPTKPPTPLVISGGTPGPTTNGGTEPSGSPSYLWPLGLAGVGALMLWGGRK